MAFQSYWQKMLKSKKININNTSDVIILWKIDFEDRLEIIDGMVQKWEGYACIILTEDSVSCSIINDYVEKHWDNLDARSGRHLLLFAATRPSLHWINEKSGGNSTLYKNYQKSDYKYQMSKVHKFLHKLENEKRAVNGDKKEIKLPALAFFDWDRQTYKSLKKSYDIKNKKTKIKLLILEFPPIENPTMVEETFFDIIKIAEKCNKESKPFAGFIEEVKTGRDIKKYKSSLKKFGSFINKFWPYIGPLMSGA